MSVPVEEIHDEMEQARVAFNSLVATASANDLRRGSNGTRWSNRQLLFHMEFGYLVVLRLLPLVRIFGRLPDRYSRRFAAVLDAVTPHDHVVNYLGLVGGGQVLTPIGMARLLDRTLTSLHRHWRPSTTPTWPAPCISDSVGPLTFTT